MNGSIRLKSLLYIIALVYFSNGSPSFAYTRTITSQTKVHSKFQPLYCLSWWLSKIRVPFKICEIIRCCKRSPHLNLVLYKIYFNLLNTVFGPLNQIKVWFAYLYNCSCVAYSIASFGCCVL